MTDKTTGQKIRESLPHLYGWPWYQWAWNFFKSTNRMNLLCAANQISKALCKHELIPTPRGFRRIGDLRIGDEVFNRRGEPRPVTAIPFDGEDECYRITFDDGSSVVASGEHEWVCKTSRERFRKSYKSGWTSDIFPNSSYDDWVKLTTKAMIEVGQYDPEAPKPWYRCSVPVTEPVKYPEKEMPIDPYLMGLLLGDGGYSDRGCVFTSIDSELVDAFRNDFELTPRGSCGWYVKGAATLLRDMGILGQKSHEKFIPERYLFGSVEQRKNLICGLMDTDGTVTSQASKATSFTTVSPQLAKDFCTLAASLGCRYKLKKRDSGYRDKSGTFVPCRDSYQIRINSPFNPFKLVRKRDIWKPYDRRHERVIYKIESVGALECRCITVGDGDTFLATDDYIVTHNSSTQIRKAIEWSTNTKLWPVLWPRNPVPRNMWYLYPDSKVATVEFISKWIPEFMPRGVFKDHPVYGWTAVYDKKRIESIKWNNGVTLHFKTYMQNPQSLQSSTVHAIFCDEELPENIYDELQFRLAGTDGYFHMVFTATLNQQLWWKAMEGKDEQEKFPEAAKQQISMYDCQTYRCGKKGAFDDDRIAGIIRKCKSDNEVKRRVYGRFIADTGRKYPAFDPSRHFVDAFHLDPGKWHFYGGVDPGGGGSGHPAAMGVIAVAPNMRKAYVCRGLRMDGEDTTSGDILNAYREMRGNLMLRNQFYDQASKDFYMVASRAGESFSKSEKSHELGEDIINTLFKNDMLFIFDTSELRKLGQELVTLRTDVVKRKAEDDFIDGAVRYICTSIPWDWTMLTGTPETKPAEDRAFTQSEYDEWVEKERRGTIDDDRERRKKGKGKAWREWESEIAEWNDLYGS